MKTQKDFDNDASDFAKWIRGNGELQESRKVGPSVENTYRVNGEDYVIVNDYWSGKLITVYDPEP